MKACPIDSGFAPVACCSVLAFGEAALARHSSSKLSFALAYPQPFRPLRWLLGLLLLFCLPLHAQQRTHIVQPGETLYSISRTYGISVEQLLALNPQAAEVLYAGATLIVPGTAVAAEVSPAPVATSAKPDDEELPACKQMYTVKKKETVYAISRRFGVSEDELRAANPQIKKNKVKKGEQLCIPYSEAEKQTYRQRRAEAARERQAQQEAASAQAKRISPINVAVILPFDLDAAERTAESTKMLDFYEGFLLAVDELKGQGISVNVYAYEERGGSMASVLSQPMMPYMNLIVGPMYADDVAPLADFATRRGIPLVVPSINAADVCRGNPTTFQVNPPLNTLYPQLYAQLTQRWKGANVVILSCEEGVPQTDYVSGLKDALEGAGISYVTASSGLLTEPDQFLPKLSQTQRNVLVPTTASQKAFISLVRRLNNAAESLAPYSISLFGYPEWQTFADANKEQMRKWNASYFATFHTDASASASQRFNRNFERWFKRAQYAAYPLYGQHGYDIGLHFLKAIDQFGTDFISHQADAQAPALQWPMQFKRLGQGDGFRNSCLRIIDSSFAISH